MLAGLDGIRHFCEHFIIGMGFFDFLKPKAKFTTPEQIAEVSYAIAYYVLPTFAHKDFDQFLKMWSNPVMSIGTVLCEYACSKKKLRPSPEHLAGFKTQEGQFSPSCEYYLLQFPFPRPYTPIAIEQMEALMAADAMPVLAPYFAVIVDDRIARDRMYYVLGQSPIGKTTFRSVTADGSNCNLGPGPEPTVSAFLEHIRRSIG